MREKASTINAWLDARCLQAGSSLQGRKEAAAFYLSARKFLPILVSLSPLEVWVPLLPQEGSETDLLQPGEHSQSRAVGGSHKKTAAGSAFAMASCWRDLSESVRSGFWFRRINLF